MPEFDSLYVAARRVLLDALEALAVHRSAIVVVGAQAIYLRTGAVELGIAAYTTDGDLALDPSRLSAEPLLEVAMRKGQFVHDLQQPGVWLARETVDGQEVTVPVDLIVPEGAAPAIGRRGARLGPHGNRAARRATGLEAALVDHSPLLVTALDAEDERAFEVEVAGETALLIAKAHKIHDRLARGRPDRTNDKDAADIYRLMQTTSPTEIATQLTSLSHNELAGETAEFATSYLVDLFGRRGSAGTQMAIRALRLAVSTDQVTALCTSYIKQVQDELTRG